MNNFWTGAAIVVAVVAIVEALRVFRTRKPKIARGQSAPMSLHDSARALILAGEAAFRSPHRQALVEEFWKLADARLENLPIRLHPAALGLLTCQIDYLQRNPERSAVALAGLRGGILGLATAGQVYELETPVPRGGAPS